jgi:hypothetical protein
MATSRTLEDHELIPVEEFRVISLGKKLTHTCLSGLRSINEYLVFDWGGKVSSSPLTPLYLSSSPLNCDKFH